MLSDRAKVGTLRGLLYAIKFAIEEKDLPGLEDELHDEIIRVLDETKDDADYIPHGEWKPGFAFTGLDYQAIRPGSLWNYQGKTQYQVTVVARDASGQVHLRPVFPAFNQSLDEWYPPGTYGKGNPDPCPFLRVDAKMASRSAKDGPREGDLLVHEAWGVWLDLLPQGG